MKEQLKSENLSRARDFAAIPGAFRIVLYACFSFCIFFYCIAPAVANEAALAIETGKSEPSVESKSDSESGSTESASKDKPIRDKWALIVGISEFKSDKIPQLKYAAKDAKDFYSFLVDHCNFKADHVRLLLDEKATERRVMSELGNKFLARLARPDDLVVLFFSTHGSPGALDLRGKSYVVAYDSDPEDLFATGIEMQKILEAIDHRVLTRRVCLILDACHSGAIAPSGKGLKRVANFDAEALAQGSGQLVICSSKPDEQSFESKRYKNGVFTRQLIKCLDQEGETVSLSNSFNLISDSVANEVREDRRGARQTPVLRSNWHGEALLLSARPTSPEAVPPTVLSDLDPDDSVPPVANIAVSKAIPTSGQQILTPGNLEREQDTNRFVKESIGGQVLQLSKDYFKVSGTPKQWIRAYTSAIRKNPRDPELFYQLGLGYVQQEDWIRALNAFADALMNTPNFAKGYLGRAYVYHRLNDPVNAMRDLKEAKFYNRALPARIEFKSE